MDKRCKYIHSQILTWFALMILMLTGCSSGKLPTGTDGTESVPWSPGKLRLDPVFTSNMVLQRGMKVRISGKANPFAEITAFFNGQQAKTHALEDGSWKLYFKPMKAFPAGKDLVVREQPAKNSGDAGDPIDTVTLSNVVVGDVWLVSGQSNAAFPMAGVKGIKLTDPVPEALGYNIRYMNVSKSYQPGITPLGNWVVVTPENAAPITAVGFYFATNLQDGFKEAAPRDPTVPIGILNGSNGATIIETWMDPDSFEAETAFLPALTAYQEKKPLLNPPAGQDPNKYIPGYMYETMIKPVMPMNIKGAVWYQGEQNARNYELYRLQLPAMIHSWRDGWNQGDFPVLIVQLPRIKGTYWHYMRESQQYVADTVPGCYLAVTIDSGDFENGHPKDKDIVGKRLYLQAMNKVYGKYIHSDGPMFESMIVEGNRIRIHFRPSKIPLQALDPALPGFQIAGPDKMYKTANARIEGDTVVVSSPEVSVPVSVRYAFSGFPPLSLGDAVGLPAAPFRAGE